MPRQARPNANTHRLGTLWIRPEEAEKLNLIACREGRTISDLCRDAIKAFVDDKRHAA